jgi:CubicO group peptidase (beta-lactamase class C family)
MIKFALIFGFIILLNAVDWTKVNDAFADAIADRVFPGGAILVANETTTIYRRNYGKFTYNYEFHDVEVSNDTKYDIASVTKVMATTLGIMNLVSSSSIKLDDLVSKYITNYDTNKKGNTTIANLLLHNSGLPYDYPGPLP